MSVNEHTGQQQKTKVPSEEYRNNYDLIFKKKKNEDSSSVRVQRESAGSVPSKGSSSV